MRRTVSALGLLLLCMAPAGAEDFTGFYAGVNAGWAFERGGARDPSTSEASAPARPDARLPPSVARIQERQSPERPTGRR
ncbi:porin family protein [Methylorubrum podarium]|uniref:porin family protein n=1 Tax=Methylorubrum podarium TaxID=200476 RepID=UPI001EE2A3EF|nr:porin family protein [Methylorubrum podarium]GJE69526.1 hypothetical protein CHKEEEPN_1054 [Methylorubrum podarium]